MNIKHDTLDQIREAVEDLEAAEESLRAMTAEGLDRFAHKIGHAHYKLACICLDFYADDAKADAAVSQPEVQP